MPYNFGIISNFFGSQNNLLHNVIYKAYLANKKNLKAFGFFFYFDALHGVISFGIISNFFGSTWL